MYKRQAIACGSLPPAFDSGSIPVSADGNWGLGFPSPGQTPVGNASADTLKNFDAFYVGDTSKPVIYLTFDAGYENGCTPAILEALKKHHVPATFFVVGNYLETSPDLVNQLIAEEMEEKRKEGVIFLCIGTDRSTGDSLGPLVGHKLRKYRLKKAAVNGKLDKPVHAVPLDLYAAYILSLIHI